MPATEPDGFPYPDSEDAANVPVDLKALADKLQERYGAIDLANLTVPGGEADDGKLAVVENGVVKLKAVSGDVTISEAGVVEIGAGKVGTTELADKGVTTGKVNDKAITLGKLAEALGLTEGYYADASVTSRKAKLTAGVVSATGDLSLTTEYKDVPGAVLEITPAVASTLKVTAVFEFSSIAAGGAQGTLRLNAEDQEPTARINAPTNEIAGTPAQVYLLALPVNTHTIKLRARRVGAGGKALAEGTRFLYELNAA